ncbi:MAG: iron dependent repressor, metal binding and dimerization domain protein [Deinococcales bacterium]
MAEVLGYAWHEVHEEAERLEHHISEGTKPVSLPS